MYWIIAQKRKFRKEFFLVGVEVALFAANLLNCGGKAAAIII
jgi:hypothetical protein